MKDDQDSDGFCVENLRFVSHCGLRMEKKITEENN